MIGVKVKPETKKAIEEAAAKEHRSLANFVKHCVFTYLKDKHKVDIYSDEE